MYIFIIVASFYTGQPDNPFMAITRSSVEYYLTEELCKADAGRQSKSFLAGLPAKPELIFGKCVKVTGPASAGNPA